MAGLIRERRLERCRRDLLDFSRAFRAADGMSPAEYRRLGDRPRPHQP